ncbi:MAG: serine/threonine protein kinase [Proteobacteria bacterium]|nr:serine/threonine protein kinase [Pseudomonadota bacterium]
MVGGQGLRVQRSTPLHEPQTEFVPDIGRNREETQSEIALGFGDNCRAEFHGETVADIPETQQPYADLSPDRILDSLEGVGFACDGRIIALNSYENRVYQLGQEDGGFVVAKFYRPGRWSDEGIGEEHRFALELVEGELPIVPPVAVDGETLHHHAGHRFAVYPRQGGRWPELGRDEDWEMLGRFIGRIHAIGATGVFAHRQSISIKRMGREASHFVLLCDWMPPHLVQSYHAIVDRLLAAVDEAFERAEPFPRLRIHGDCHFGNVLWTDDGPHFVDLDDCVTGPAVQDLWLFLSGEREERSLQLQRLLRGYRQFHDFDYRELHLIEALRTLRMINYTAWIARRWEDPAFPKAFPWFVETKYWEEHVLALKEQAAALAEPVLEVL